MGDLDSSVPNLTYNPDVPRGGKVWPAETSFIGERVSTFILAYNDHPRDPKIVAVDDRWSLFRGSFML